MSGNSNGLYFRSSLARSLFEKIQADAQLQKFDKSVWYKVSTDVLSPVLFSTFLQLSFDCQTQHFLDTCQDKSDALFTQIYHSLMATFMGFFMTKTSINGWLSRGSMFVLSDEQFQKLLAIDQSFKGEQFLDIGAGDGKVTDVMAKYFNQTFVTEASPVMRKLLAGKNYKVLEIDSWTKDDVKYDLISCLNVLDRCEKPQTLLQDMISKLKADTGLLLIALVIPFQPYVEFSSDNSNKPSEKFEIQGKTFEEQVNSLHQNIFEPLNLEVIRWTKVPYLCEGNLQRSYYWLVDVVFLLRPKSPPKTNDECPVDNEELQSVQHCDQYS